MMGLALAVQTPKAVRKGRKLISSSYYSGQEIFM
uniref:Uncharacterized protein n=1 Tax=Rhizophora mucronata TaxID=61149 RepID=A0A2P2P7J0_RHIMU